MCTSDRHTSMVGQQLINFGGNKKLSPKNSDKIKLSLKKMIQNNRLPVSFKCQNLIIQVEGRYKYLNGKYRYFEPVFIENGGFLRHNDILAETKQAFKAESTHYINNINGIKGKESYFNQNAFVAIRSKSLLYFSWYRFLKGHG